MGDWLLLAVTGSKSILLHQINVDFILRLEVFHTVTAAGPPLGWDGGRHAEAGLPRGAMG